MVRRIVLLAALVVTVLVTSPASALSPTCLPGGFPGPTPPVATTTGHYGADDDFYVEVWRAPCQDGSGEVALLLRATPVTPSPFVCSVNFDFQQGGQFIDGRLLPSGSESSFCEDLAQTTTFSLERVLGPPFDTKAAFTLVIDSSSSLVPNTLLEVGAYAPPPVQLGLTVVSTGCSPCSTGQLAQLHLHVVNLGPPVTVELKTGIHLPTGFAITLLGLYVEQDLGSGEFDLPLAGLVVPADVPNGTYVFEAALLDPIFGVTLARHSLGLVKQ